MPAGKQSRQRRVLADGSLAPELVGTRYGSLKIVSNRTEGTTFNLRAEVSCKRCGKRHMALFHNIRKRPQTAACPHCNGRRPVTVPQWLYERCQAQQDRCCNPTSTAYRGYGKRGIEFRFQGPNEAARWVADNLGIAKRSMHLDRIDNDGHYEPGNLRWSTLVASMNNTRKSNGSKRARFIAFRRSFPDVRYADKTLYRLIKLGLTDKQIMKRWAQPSHKPKGKYGTFSTLGPYRGSLPTDG